MSWNVTPSAAAALGAAALNDRRFVDQFWYAVAERYQAAGGVSPFPQAHAYDTFTITAISDGGSSFTITAGAKNWGTAPDWWGLGVAPGTGYAPDWAASTFDVIIDADRTGAGLSEPDQRSVIQGVITANTATTLTVSFNLSRFVKKGAIPSAASLVGRRGWIVRHDGDNYTRGFIRWPNALHYAYGLVAADPAPAAGTHTSDLALQHAGVLVGKEALYLDATSELQRGTITAVSGQTLTYTGTTAPAVAGQPCYVVDAGGYWDWGRTGGPVQAAHAGLTTPYYAHAVGDDGVTTVGMPRLTFPVLYGSDPLSCPVGPELVTIRDVDYYIPYDNACAAGDVYVQPKFWQSWRSLWAGLTGLCGFFVKPIDHTGASSIPNFTVATWLHYAGINGTTGTTGTHSGGSMPCALSVPHTPVNLYWTITDDDGSELLSGQEDAYDGTQITGTFSAAHDGKPVIASVGPTRYCARAFDTMQDVTYFVPEVDSGAAQVPPSNTYPGTWSVIPAATHYLVSDKDGYVGRSTLARHAIADGHIARYAGHRLHDPGLPVRLPADTPDPTAPYHNNGYVGLRQPDVQRRLDAALTGRATGGSTRRIVVAGVDFDALDFMAATNGLTHSFTAAGGSTTGCAVPGVGGTALWAAARFPGFAGPFVGFCVEFLTSGASFADPDAVVEKRLIATGTTGGAITWAEPTSASVDGRPGRIVEPLRLNPFRGRRLELTAGDGTVAVVTVEGGHGDTLFIPDPGFAVDADTTFRPDPTEPRINDTTRRTDGRWVTTAGLGADARYGGSTFRADAAANMEDLFVEYGLPLPTDVTFATVTGPQELYDAINVLYRVKATATWTADGELNQNVPPIDPGWGVYSGDPADAGAAWRDLRDGVSGFYDDPSANPLESSPPSQPSTGGLPPRAWTSGEKGRDTVAVGIGRSYGYPVASGLPDVPFPRSAIFYNYGWIDAFDTAAGDHGTGGEYDNYTFDANGDSVAYRQWTQFATAGPTTATSIMGGKFGSLTRPTWVDEPPDLGAYPAAPNNPGEFRGYYVGGLVAVADFDFKFK